MSVFLLSWVLSPRNVYRMVQKVPENREHIRGSLRWVFAMGLCDGSLLGLKSPKCLSNGSKSPRKKRTYSGYLRWVFVMGLSNGLERLRK